jgi:hypothetical protein
MQVNGYKIREALKMKALELTTIQSQFDESLFIFEGDQKESPIDISDKITKLEVEIAMLQAAQSEYNLKVKVEVEGKTLPLEAAVKMVGGAGRLSKMWRTAAGGAKRERWDRGFPTTRNKEDVVAQPTISKSKALELAKAAERLAASLRNAIAVGNNTVVAIDWIGESLFDL